MKKKWMICGTLVACATAAGCGRANDEQGNANINTEMTQTEIKIVSLKKHEVKLSPPLQVMRSKGYAWFPTLIKLANGDLQVVVSNNADAAVKDMTGLNVFSKDSGKTWSEPVAAPYSEDALRLDSGDELFLPYYLTPAEDGLEAPYTRVAKGTNEIKVMPGKLTVTDWPHPIKGPDPQTGVAAFSFNGQNVALKSGGYLATMYGHFEGDQKYSLIAVESADGVQWKVRSIIADGTSKLPGDEGPCESALCYLRDGRLMSVFRLAGQNMGFGQCWSEDEGETWSAPVYMGDVHAVQPSLAVMKDGTVLLTSGRSGLFLYVNAQGDGKKWERVDLQALHNEYCPEEPIKATTTFSSNTTSYTEIAVLDETHLLVVYDRLAIGWNPLPPDSKESNTVWVVPIELVRN